MIESLEDFYQRINRTAEASRSVFRQGSQYFDIQQSRCSLGKTSFSYRDFYKVGLITHTGKLYYADKWIYIDRPAVLFSTPLVPYAWEAIAECSQPSYFCVFNEAFIQNGDRVNALAETPLFDISKDRIYFVDENTQNFIHNLFVKMEEELSSDYFHKGDIMRCYLHLLVHEIMKNQTVSNYVPQKNAAQRTAELFLALLERQFPVELPNKILLLKTPNDYAERLSVHVNHLNRVVKSTLGRTTSTIITSRIVQEGIQLLQHSSYSVSEISYALGFEETASFSNFIKKHTKMSPTLHRSLLAV